MDILSWIQKNHPGAVQDIGDRLEVVHESGEHTTLWKRRGVERLSPMEELLDCYRTYDGMDLFSSTFKIASLVHPKTVDEVRITFTLQSLAWETKETNCVFPHDSVPFMYQAGTGYYAVDATSGTIYEWDIESGEISDEFDSLEAILNEWAEAVA